MAENHSSSKRKYDDPSPPPLRMQFSPAALGALPAAGGTTDPSSHKSLRPLPDEVQLAKRRAQEIVDGGAEAKRPRVVSGADECSRGCGADLNFSSPADYVNVGKSGETWENHKVKPRAKIQEREAFQSAAEQLQIQIANNKVEVVVEDGDTIKPMQTKFEACILFCCLLFHNLSLVTFY